MPPKTPVFTVDPKVASRPSGPMPLLPLQTDLVYGPVRSRRLGVSLGLNIFPARRKICNFNCAYCQYGWTREDESAVRAEEWPEPVAIADAVRQALEALGRDGRPVDRLTLAGNGEPTLHPRFGEVVERLRDVRDECCKEARLAVLSNGGTLDRPAVVAALARIDDKYLKLDTVDSETFRRLNGARSGLPRLLDALRTISHVTIQSLFTRDAAGKIDNTTPEAVERWIAALKAIQPDAVHVYSLDRAPAWSALQVVARSELESIASRARAAGLNAMVF